MVVCRPGTDWVVGEAWEVDDLSLVVRCDTWWAVVALVSWRAAGDFWAVEQLILSHSCQDEGCDPSVSVSGAGVHTTHLPEVKPMTADLWVSDEVPRSSRPVCCRRSYPLRPSHRSDKDDGPVRRSRPPVTTSLTLAATCIAVRLPSMATNDEGLPWPPTSLNAATSRPTSSVSQR